MIKIYGPQMSSASRCRWAAEEVGVAYENVEVDMKGGEHKTEAYLKLNPNGYVPTLVDGNFVMWESFAINQYLAEKYAPALCGSSPEERGLVAQWSFWNVANLISSLLPIMHHKYRNLPEDESTKTAHENLTKYMGVLDGQLAGKTFLVAERFTLADLNVMTSVILCSYIGVDTSTLKNVTRWAASLSARPAFQKAMPKRA